MSSEDTEFTLKSKLVHILEEELSALKLSDVKDEADVECSSDSHLSEVKLDVVDKKAAFSSSSDNTAEVFQEGDPQKEVKCLNPPNEDGTGRETEETNHQRQEIGYIPKMEAFNPMKEAERKMQPAYTGNQKQSTDESSFVAPSDSLSQKILREIELYFQNYNVFKNSFLLNHIRRNKKGYVNLKLVANLRKIKALTKDCRVVAYSLKNSKILEMNPDCNKIRRIEPIPKIEDTKFGKTVMVFNLPCQNPTEDCLRELFSKFGNVVSVGVFEINSPESDAYHRRCLNFHRKIASNVYGIVEFELYEEAVNALKDEEDNLPKENQIKVVPLIPQIFKKERKHLKFLKEASYNKYSRGGYKRFQPTNEARITQNDVPPANGEGFRYGKMNVNGYQYNRGNFRRPYRGGRAFQPPNAKKYAGSQFPSNNYSETKIDKWEESRQLRANNSFNVDNFYPNMKRRRYGSAFVDM